MKKKKRLETKNLVLRKETIADLDMHYVRAGEPGDDTLNTGSSPITTQLKSASCPKQVVETLDACAVYQKTHECKNDDRGN